MSLRVRLALLITLLFVAVLCAGSTYAIFSARKTITEEIQSAAMLTSNMIAASVSTIQGSGDLELFDKLLYELGRLEMTRHMETIISLDLGAGSTQPLQPAPTIDADAEAPMHAGGARRRRLGAPANPAGPQLRSCVMIAAKPNGVLCSGHPVGVYRAS